MFTNDLYLHVMFAHFIFALDFYTQFFFTVMVTNYKFKLQVTNSFSHVKFTHDSLSHVMLT